MDAKDLQDELRRALPPGLEELLDLEDDPGRLLLGLAQVLKDTGADLLDRLRQELSPLSATELGTSDREKASGLDQSDVTRSGTLEQRRQQVIARLREYGAPTLDKIRAIMQPFLQYQDPSTIALVEVSRDDLRTAHSRVWAGPVIIPPAASLTWTVRDDPAVSAAGVQVDLYLTCDNLANVTAVLTAPDGFPLPFSGIGRGDTVVGLQPTVRLYAKQMAGRPIFGTWQLTINSSNAADSLLGAILFVEGLGRDSKGGDGLGAAKFKWGVVVEDAKLGAGYNLAGAADALRRINYATRVVYLIRRSIGGGALPPGDFRAVVDDPHCLPDACLCG